VKRRFQAKGNEKKRGGKPIEKENEVNSFIGDNLGLPETKAGGKGLVRENINKGTVSGKGGHGYFCKVRGMKEEVTRVKGFSSRTEKRTRGVAVQIRVKKFFL